MNGHIAGGRTAKYGCASASFTSILLLGLNVRHFSIRSIACGLAPGNKVAKGLFLRKGRARMYSRDRCEVIA